MRIIQPLSIFGEQRAGYRAGRVPSRTARVRLESFYVDEMPRAEELGEPGFVVVDGRPRTDPTRREAISRTRLVGRRAASAIEAGRDRVTGFKGKFSSRVKRIGELRHRNPPLLRPCSEPLAIEGGGAHRSRHQANRAIGIVEHRKDERLQIVLGIDDVAEGSVMDGEQDRRSPARAPCC